MEPTPHTTTAPTSVADQLDTWLEERTHEIENEPDNRGPIDRMLGACRAINRERAEVEATYAHRVAELAQWRDERFAVLDGRRSRLETRLEGWARAEHERTGGRDKTWKLANGTLEIRPADDVIELAASPDKIGDELKAVGHGDLTFPKATASKTLILQAIEKGAYEVGPPVADYELPAGRQTYTAHRVITDPDAGEALPGVYLLRPSRKRFNLRPALPVRGSEPTVDELPEGVTS